MKPPPSAPRRGFVSTARSVHRAAFIVAAPLVVGVASCADSVESAGASCGGSATWALADLGVTTGNTTYLQLRPTHFSTHTTAPPAGCGASGATRRASLRYVTRGTGRVVVSWTPSVAAVTDLWVSLACNAAAPPLACGGSFTESVPGTARVIATRSVPAGTALTIVLATATPSGALTVSEVVDEVPLGGSCDTWIRADRCVDGATCTRATCTPWGALGAACRSAEPRCDAGLACDITSAPGGRCAPVVAPGALCPTFGTRCEGGRCMIVEGALRCVGDGTEGGPCRAMGVPCDEGLGCLDGVCRPRVASGAPCGPPAVPYAMCPEGEACSVYAPRRCVPSGGAEAPCRAERPHCNPGFICHRDPMFPTTGWCVAQAEAPPRCGSGMSSACPYGAVCAGPVEARRCAWPGAAGGLCDLHDRCDDGLVCIREGLGSRSECLPPGAPGEPCVRFGGGESSCAAPGACVQVEGNRRCVAAGSPGGPCLGGATACEPGLRCSHQRICAPPTATTAVCDPAGVSDACPSGQRCSISGTCVAAGRAEGFCRVTAPSCDRGLRCVRDRATAAVCVEG